MARELCKLLFIQLILFDTANIISIMPFNDLVNVLILRRKKRTYFSSAIWVKEYRQKYVVFIYLFILFYFFYFFFFFLRNKLVSQQREDDTLQCTKVMTYTTWEGGLWGTDSDIYFFSSNSV